MSNVIQCDICKKIISTDKGISNYTIIRHDKTGVSKTEFDVCDDCLCEIKKWMEYFEKKVDEKAEAVNSNTQLYKQDEHQPTTRGDKLLEMFPRAPIRNGILNVRPCGLDTELERRDCYDIHCDDCKIKYWNEVLEDIKEELLVED